MKLTREDELSLQILRGNVTAIELKEYQDIVKLRSLNGNNLILTCSQVVQQLKHNVPNLTTTIFNEWLAEVLALGTYNKIGKRRVFQPNKQYESFVSGQGFAITGKTLSNKKTTAYYTQSMITRIMQHHLASLIEYTNYKNS